ncbi:uncharacterized protein LOC143894922 [Temnothorax americanus]|uniref:uncharacterized protein LOC143894922 n=1 Tax=Temnothorax americanus TaxID=1964332 RepID=UPI004068CEA2
MKTLATSLSTYVPLKGFYKDSVTCNDGKIALIFTTDKLLHELGKSTELYVDGTFNIIPRVPLMSQMYTIHIRHTNVGVATIFILCECRSSNMYTAIWKKIVELMLNNKNNIKFLMSDYETAAMKAMSEQFPTAEAHGCWFHFNQVFLMSDYETAAMKAMSEQFPTAEAHGCWFHFNQQRETSESILEKNTRCLINVSHLQGNLQFNADSELQICLKMSLKMYPHLKAYLWFGIHVKLCYGKQEYTNIFLQALSRYWRRLGLTDAPRNILSMTMTMALIPSNYFEEAFSLIQLEANQIYTEYPAICDFLNYIRKTWLPLASKVSVYDCPVRTNNITESFHNIVGKRIRKGNIWNFLDNLQKIIVDEEIKLKRLQAGENIGCRTNIKNKTRDHKILEAQRHFTNCRISLQCFLHLFCDGCENFYQNDKLIFKDIEDDSQADTSKSDEDVTSKTKLNTLSNNTNSNTDSNIDENIAKEEPVQEGLLHYEGENCVPVKRSKRTKQIKKTKQTKRRKKLLTADKENSYNEHGNIPERSIDMTKFPKLVLPRIDQQLQTNGRQALQKLNNSNCQV